MVKTEAYKEADVLCCDSCGEAIEECFHCGDVFEDGDEIYCEEVGDYDCEHYCLNCGGIK